MTDYDSMTIEELEQHNRELSRDRDQVLQEQLTINSVLNRKIAERNAQETLEQMSDIDREAMAGALK